MLVHVRNGQSPLTAHYKKTIRWSFSYKRTLLQVLRESYLLQLKDIKMKPSILIGVFIVTLITTRGLSKVYDRCELARELHEIHKFPQEDISKWLCLLYWESRYDTSVEKRNSDGSVNYGLFQINDRYWCQSSQKSPGINICQLSCNQLRDDNIYDDVNCVLEMFHRHNFNVWPSSFEKCSGNLTAWITPCHTFHQRNGYAHQQGYVPQNPHQPTKSVSQPYEHQYNRDYGSHGGGQRGGGIKITPNGVHVSLSSSPLSGLLSGGLGGLVNLLSGVGGLTNILSNGGIGGLGSLLSGGGGGGLNNLLSSLTGKLRVKPFFKVYNTISLGADH